MTDSCFRLKGSAVTVVVLELHQYGADRFATEFEQTIRQAPQLFQRSPVVIDLEQCVSEEADLDLPGLLRQCRDFGLQPVGFRDCARYASALADTGLALLPPLKNRAVRKLGEAASAAQAAEGAGAGPGSEPAPESLAEAAAAPEPEPVPEPVPEPPAAEPPAPPEPAPTSKLVTQPVRSGQQIYARGTDLIVMAQVSEGAEVLADGNIHIYGGLRGRALAGVNGDQSARVFCRSLEAELLSVAGNFILSEEIRARVWKEPAQAYLKGDSLCVEPL